MSGFSIYRGQVRETAAHADDAARMIAQNRQPSLTSVRGLVAGGMRSLQREKEILILILEAEARGEVTVSLAQLRATFDD